MPLIKQAHRKFYHRDVHPDLIPDINKRAHHHRKRQNLEDQWYEDQGRLASEHASLDDNGDALFTLNPTANDADGRLAEIAYIDVLSAEDGNLSGQSLAFKSRMQELERSVFILRGRKADYLEDDYWAQMEELLVELARTTGQYNDSL